MFGHFQTVTIQVIGICQFNGKCAILTDADDPKIEPGIIVNVTSTNGMFTIYIVTDGNKYWRAYRLNPSKKFILAEPIDLTDEETSEIKKAVQKWTSERM